MGKLALIVVGTFAALFAAVVILAAVVARDAARYGHP